jgi:hypothetical protein
MKTEQKQSKWTDWTEIDDNRMFGMYKTNGKKIRVKLSDDFVGESCCSKYDVFNLDFGIRMAYLRCLVKVWNKKKVDIDEEIAMINADIKEMIDSLCN